MTQEGQYLRTSWLIFRNGWWILTLSVVVAALAAFFVTRGITPIYEASTKILVQGGQSPGVPSIYDIQASEQLATNYSDLIKTRPILEQVIESLSLGYGPGTLSSKISIRSPRSLIEIKAEDRDPQVAAQISNTTAQTFIDNFRDRQFSQIAQFQASLGQYGITEDPTLIAAQAATMSTLSIAEPAVPPSSPSSPNIKVNVMLAAILGLLVGGLIVYFVESLDDRIKSPDELQNIAGHLSMDSVSGGIPYLGSISRQRVKPGSVPNFMTDGHRFSALAESYKYVALNLEYTGVSTGETKTILITSGLSREGKTTTAVNLAASLALGGASVVLVDADLRKPALHTVFGLDNSRGLTNAIVDGTSLDDLLLPTDIDSLKVITSGPLPPDPTHLLRSQRFRALVESLADQVNVVIFDSSPALLVTDSIVMAAQVDGIILVVDASSARKESLRRVAQLLQQTNTPILGAVFNKVSVRSEGYYGYGYGYEGSNSKNGAIGILPQVMSPRMLKAAIERIRRLKEAVIKR
jgi:non-specific protein-tyrosine kinase